MSKKLSLFALATLYSFSIAPSDNFQLSEESIISSYKEQDSPWQYLEWLFVYKPASEQKQLAAHAQGVVGGIGAAVLLKNYFYDSQQPAQKTTCSKQDFLQRTSLFLSAFAAASTMYNYCMCLTKRTLQHKTLKNILDNWQLHRHHLPTSFIECFDSLHETYLEHGDNVLTNSVVSEVYELINHHLEHHFDKRYKKDDGKKESTISTFKTLTDIWKNLDK